MDGRFSLSLTVVCLCFSAGIAALLLLPVLPPWYWFAVLMLLLCWPCAYGFTVRVVLVCVLAGAVWLAWFGERQLALWLPADQENSDRDVSGYLTGFALRTERGWQFDFQADTLGGPVRLTWYDEQVPRTDCLYTLQVKLRRPRGLLNDGLFDYQAWLLQAGYVATGYVRRVTACEPRPVPRLLAWRMALDEHLVAAPVSPAASAALRALLIGNYSGIGQTDWHLLRASGTIHLLSVSGLHITLVAGLVYALVLYACRAVVWPCHCWPASVWGGVAAVCAALVYAWLAGFSVATQRSVLMVIVVALCRLCHARVAPLLPLWLAMMAVLLLNPLSMLSCGFWFSFLATAVLLQYTDARLPPSSSPLAVLRDMIWSQWVMFVLLAPLLLYVYGSQPWLSLPFNLLAVPWVSLVSLPLAFAAMAVQSFFALPGEWLLRASAWTLDVYWLAMEWAVMASRGWELHWPVNSLWTLLPTVSGLAICLLAPRSLPRRRAALLLCLPLLIAADSAPERGAVDIAVLDVGQGLAVLVRTARHSMVYDAGDRRSERFDAGRDIVVPAVRRLGLERLDMLMISHSDSDHAGGMAGLLAEIPASQCWSGTPEALDPVAACLPCRAGMHWRWDGVDFRVLHPDALSSTAPAKDNDRSCVLMVEAGGRRALLTGDIESAVERSLLRDSSDVQADILLVPHHGSRTSSSTAFIEAVQPRQAVVSSGFLNRFHHPASQVVARYAARNISLYNTAEQGAVRYQLSARGVDVETALCRTPRWWREDRVETHCNRAD